MKRKNMAKRVLAAALSAVLGLSLMACGGEESTVNKDEKDNSNAAYVYVPEYIEMADLGENSWRSQVTFQEDKLYYTIYSYDEETGISENKICSRSINDLATEQLLDIPNLEVEGYDTGVSSFKMDKDGNLYVFYYVSAPYIEGQDYNYDDNTTYLVKYDSSLKQVYSQDLGEMFTDEYNTYIQDVAVGKDGKLFASSGETIYVIGGDGIFQTTIPTQTDWIQSIFATEEGRVFFIRYSNTGAGMEMVEINTETNQLGESYSNLPDNAEAKGGSDGKILIKGSGNLYEYHLETQESTPILNWIDCYLTGDYVQDFTMLEDGNVLVYYDDYEGNEELVKLVKTEASSIVEKEVITFATLYDGDQSLEQAVVKFNKSSDKYKIVFKAYIDRDAEWTETTYADAIALMNADLTSNNVPDLIDLSSVDLSNLANKGVLEDLAPYLEKSSVISKEDFQSSVLDGYTIDGKLVTIPRQFSLNTLMAKTSLVGEESGWTMDDVIALADANPDAILMRYVDPAQALRICLQYSSESFIDYETGTCNFDSPEFIKVLEFANRFEPDYENEESYPSQIQSGKVLLSDVYISDTQEFQMYTLMFEEPATCIGYPTVDGSEGVFLNGMGMYGIPAKSTHKEGAWAFLESYLSPNSTDRYSWGLSTRIDELEERFAEDMKPDYQYDENGEIMLDENGEPMQYSKTSWGYDDWEVEIYAASQETIDKIKELIRIAKPAVMSDEGIFEMINEEAAAYFEGQKSAEDVAKIIQSRVSIYVSENS